MLLQAYQTKCKQQQGECKAGVSASSACSACWCALLRSSRNLTALNQQGLAKHRTACGSVRQLKDFLRMPVPFKGLIDTFSSSVLLQGRWRASLTIQCIPDCLLHSCLKLFIHTGLQLIIAGRHLPQAHSIRQLHVNTITDCRTEDWVHQLATPSWLHCCSCYKAVCLCGVWQLCQAMVLPQRHWLKTTSPSSCTVEYYRSNPFNHSSK